MIGTPEHGLAAAAARRDARAAVAADIDESIDLPRFIPHRQDRYA